MTHLKTMQITGVRRHIITKKYKMPRGCQFTSTESKPSLSPNKTKEIYFKKPHRQKIIPKQKQAKPKLVLGGQAANFKSNTTK